MFSGFPSTLQLLWPVGGMHLPSQPFPQWRKVPLPHALNQGLATWTLAEARTSADLPPALIAEACIARPFLLGENGTSYKKPWSQIVKLCAMRTLLKNSQTHQSAL